MKGGRLPQGYTVVEVMLFLAISGIMFGLAATFVNGKQGKAEFQQSMNVTVADIRDVINDVANGSYTVPDDFYCYDNGAKIAFSNSTPKTQGTNKGCVFLGKVIKFGDGSDTSTYTIFTVAGRQFVGSNTVATAFGNGPGGVGQEAIPAPGFTETKKIPYGSTIISTNNASTYVSPPASDCAGSNAGSIGFFGSFGSYSGAALQSGAQSVVVTCVPASQLSQNLSPVDSHIKNIKSQHVMSGNDFKICFDSGVGQKASITIGGANSQQQLAVNLKMGDPSC